MGTARQQTDRETSGVAPGRPGGNGRTARDRISPRQRTALAGRIANGIAIEAQGLLQLHEAVRVAPDPRLAEIFETQLPAREAHQRRLCERLAAHEAEGSGNRQMGGGGVAVEIFAAGRADVPERSVAHAFAYAHLQIATQARLARFARLASDTETAEVAEEIAVKEQATADGLTSCFDLVVDPSPGAEQGEGPGMRLTGHLITAHATEREGLHLLESALSVLGDNALREPFERHLRQSERHEQSIRERLEVHGAGPASTSDSVLPVTGMQAGALFAVQPDSADRLLAFAYAYEHLEIATYELLTRAAKRAGDRKVLAAASRALEEERAFATELSERWLRDGAAF